MTDKPQIVDQQAHDAFCTFAHNMGLDPDDLWVGRYVDYEWEHGRHVFEHACPSLEGQHALEFGCNYGATAIVLATLGVTVTAIDINEQYVELAKLNAARYGLSENITFLHVTDTTQLPFETAQFDLVSCNSVLEYVPIDILQKVQGEIDRVLAKNGLIFIAGTSNRIWPKEVHSGKWWVNYLPPRLDHILFAGQNLERGVFPWQILRGFGNYQNADLTANGKAYLAAKASMGVAQNRLQILRITNRLLNLFGITVGLVTPSISVTLRKA
ncbi:MAG TPA: class I SAM-dependent methyltransferase [Gammaproteobacteria bacterium]|nr:class I SAM-dependent methyltransferase [Gammaproteobacteria bacterium]